MGFMQLRSLALLAILVDARCAERRHGLNSADCSGAHFPAEALERLSMGSAAHHVCGSVKVFFCV